MGLIFANRSSSHTMLSTLRSLSQVRPGCDDGRCPAPATRTPRPLSLQTTDALLALDVSPWLALDITARRALRQKKSERTGPQVNEADAKWTEDDLQQARSVLGEQFIGLFALLARRHACRGNEAQVLVIDPRGDFALDFEKALARHLQFPPSHRHYADVLRGLASDFRLWVASRPAELVSLGLTDQGSDGVFVTCKAPPLILTPPD